MNACLRSGMAAIALLVGYGVAAADDSITGKINNGGAKAATPMPLPRASTLGGNGPNSLDDPARDDQSTVKSRAANHGGNPGTGVQDAAPGNAPPGASPQTMPSTLSPENAADDRRSWEQRELQLTDAQKQTIRTNIMREKEESAVPGVERATVQARVGTQLPSSVTMHDLPRELTAQIPNAEGFKYVRAGTKLLLVKPVSRMVVGVLD